MAKKTVTAEAVALPPLPPRSIDANALHAALAQGKGAEKALAAATGDSLPAASEPETLPADEPASAADPA